MLPRKSLVLGGEAAEPGLVAELLAAAGDGQRIFNHYGPTETTIGVATAELTGPGEVPVGAPVGNTRCYVLDDALVPVLPGVTGELYVAGAQVAQGYVGRPGMTAERFVACPHVPGGRMYRTGDRARWTRAGELVFAGRADDQVKVRGFRVEPGEVQAVLRAHPQVSQAAVIARHGSLVSYVVPRGEAREGLLTGGSVIRRTAASRLPGALRPRRPGRAAADLQRQTRPRSLPTPPDEETTGAERAPANEREALLCTLFAEVLKRASVRVDEDFFALGGHSLLAIVLVAKVRAALDAEMDIRTLFEAPTPAQLARKLTEERRSRPALRPRPRS